jgi:hypothetical protein
MKISEYPAYSNLQPNDILLVVANTDTDPATKSVRYKDILAHLSANTSITANFTVTGDVTVSGNNYNVTSTHVNYTNLSIQNLKVSSNGFIVSTKYTPANSSISEAGSAGKFSFDDDYIYVKTANNVTKRVALSTF